MAGYKRPEDVMWDPKVVAAYLNRSSMPEGSDPWQMVENEQMRQRGIEGVPDLIGQAQADARDDEYQRLTGQPRPAPAPVVPFTVEQALASDPSLGGKAAPTGQDRWLGTGMNPAVADLKSRIVTNKSNVPARISKAIADSYFGKAFSGQLNEDELKQAAPAIAVDIGLGGGTAKGTLTAGLNLRRGRGGGRLGREARIEQEARDVIEGPGIGHNMPPPEGAWMPPEVVRVQFPKQGAFKTMTEVPSLRDLPIEEATARAVENPHLIKGGAGSEGLYVGGPRDIKTRRDLTEQRKRYDRFIAEDPRGGDWYDRYRAGLTETTGGRRDVNAMQAALHGQLSAGVDPGTETAMALRFNNSALVSGGNIPQGKGAGYGRPENRRAFQAAIDQNDPAQMARGEKTGEYARLISPDDQVAGATGVNDFRHQINLGYTLPGGRRVGYQGQINKPAAHRFMDYETANAVARANRAMLGGRNDWTGEQLQAAPWVRQKAQDLMADSNGRLSYEEAFQLANRTYKEYLDKHTVAATYEQMPGTAWDHLPRLREDAAARERYFRDPLSRDTVGNLDAYYGSLQLPQAPGVAMQVRPTIEGQGVYTPPGAATEFNNLEIARPMVGIVKTPEGRKVAPDDRSIVDLVERFRNMMSGQNVGAWHINTVPGAQRDIRGIDIPLPDKMTPAEAAALEQVAKKHGLYGPADRGQGATLSTWGDPDAPGGPAIAKALRKGTLEQDIRQAVPRAGRPDLVGGDSGYIDLATEMAEGGGKSGVLTQKFISELNANPHIAEMLNRSELIPVVAQNKFLRDVNTAAALGGDRLNEGLQNLRQIIGAGPDWKPKLERALAEGKVILPALAASLLGLEAARRLPNQGPGTSGGT